MVLRSWKGIDAECPQLLQGLAANQFLIGKDLGHDLVWEMGREDTREGHGRAREPLHTSFRITRLLLTQHQTNPMQQLIDAFPRQLKEALEIGRKAALKAP